MLSIESVGGANAALPVEDDGTEVVAAPSALNFTGDGVTVTDAAGKASIAIPGGGSLPLDASGLAAGDDVITFASGALEVSADGTARFITTDSTKTPLVVRGAASQTANLQQWQTSAGTAVTRVLSSGQLQSALALSLAGGSTNDRLNFSGAGWIGRIAADNTKYEWVANNASGQLRLIVGGNTRIDADGTGLGFFGTTPVARPTGVAVTAEGIHAALVSLGLITA